MKDLEYLDECKDAFLKWLDNNDNLERVNGIVFPSYHFLLEVFIHTPILKKDKSGKEINIIGIDNKSLSKKRREVLIPYAKVLAIGRTEDEFYKQFKPGDIAAVSDLLGQIVKNPQYDFVMEAMKERPAPEIEIPPKYIGGISKWYPHQFILDKIDTILDEEVDEMIFLVAQANILAKIDRSYFDKYRTLRVAEVESTIKDSPKKTVKS